MSPLCNSISPLPLPSCSPDITVVNIPYTVDICKQILFETWIIVQYFWPSPDRQTDRQKATHMSPPCKVHKWAQKGVFWADNLHGFKRKGLFFRTGNLHAMTMDLKKGVFSATHCGYQWNSLWWFLFLVLCFRFWREMYSNAKNWYKNVSVYEFSMSFFKKGGVFKVKFSTFSRKKGG